MIIEFLRDFQNTSPDQLFPKGSSIEVPDPTGEELIASGIAKKIGGGVLDPAQVEKDNQILKAMVAKSNAKQE